MAIVEQAASAEQVSELSAVKTFPFPIHLAHRARPVLRVEHGKRAFGEAPVEPGIVRYHDGSRTSKVFDLSLPILIYTAVSNA